MKKLIITVIPEQCTEPLIKVIKTASTAEIMTFSARGTAQKALLQRLGLGQTKKAVVCIMEEAPICNAVCSAIEKVVRQETNCTGILFTLFTEKKNMVESSEHSVICVIVNSGYGEAVMEAARKAGARGGTIINARGTGTEQDMNFFGIQIIPEKEMLLMVAEHDIAKKLIEAVKALPLLEKPGSGIVFTIEADSCISLGGLPK